MVQRSGTLRFRLRQQTRSEIVRTAFALFGEHGYDKVSVEKIAATAGISRGTFFNYFPQKELLLGEIVQARSERLKEMLEQFVRADGTVSFDGIIQLVVDVAEENARISRGSKRLLLEAFCHQASTGMLLSARQRAVDAMAKAIGRIPRRKRVGARLVAETLFTVYLTTMLEWLMRSGASQRWLPATMRERLELVVEGVA
jgi:AcrR family transcriptional regulator